MKIIKQILEKLVCKHRWYLHKQFNIYEKNIFGMKTGLPIKVSETLICKECGKIKRIEL